MGRSRAAARALAAALLLAVSAGAASAEPVVEGIALPGCFDVASALISEDAGFEAIFLSGYGVAGSFLGNQDIGLTTLSETAQLARNVVDAVNIPVVVDVDDGFGNE
jgi:2-methylisocitrate lyase-like PEP mutase family enzyme